MGVFDGWMGVEDAQAGGGEGRDTPSERETVFGWAFMVGMDSFRLFPLGTVSPRRVEKIRVVPSRSYHPTTFPSCGAVGKEKTGRDGKEMRTVSCTNISRQH